MPYPLLNIVQSISAHYLHRHQHAGVLIPAQQRVLPIPRLGIFNVRPAVHKLLMARHLCQFPCHRAVDIFNDVKVCGEEDIKVSLVDLQGILANLQEIDA